MKKISAVFLLLAVMGMIFGSVYNHNMVCVASKSSVQSDTAYEDSSGRNELETTGLKDEKSLTDVSFAERALIVVLTVLLLGVTAVSIGTIVLICKRSYVFVRVKKKNSEFDSDI